MHRIDETTAIKPVEELKLPARPVLPYSGDVVVVEGPYDKDAVLRAVDCEVIVTNGWEVHEHIGEMQDVPPEQKLIILTDSDGTGEKIRALVDSSVNDCTHARLPGPARRVENASPEEILAALTAAGMRFLEAAAN